MSHCIKNSWISEGKTTEVWCTLFHHERAKLQIGPCSYQGLNRMVESLDIGLDGNMFIRLRLSWFEKGRLIAKMYLSLLNSQLFWNCIVLFVLLFLSGLRYQQQINHQKVAQTFLYQFTKSLRFWRCCLSRFKPKSEFSSNGSLNLFNKSRFIVTVSSTRKMFVLTPVVAPTLFSVNQGILSVPRITG